MPIIRPSADLRNKYKELSKLAKETKEPIFITVNGKEDTVLCDVQMFDEIYAKMKIREIYKKGQEEVDKGELYTWEEVKKKLGI